MDPKQVDLRHYFNESEYGLLREASRLMAIFNSGSEKQRQDILSTGIYERRPIENHIGILLRFAKLSNPESTLDNEYTKIFSNKKFKGYNPLAKRKWEDYAAPLEVFLARAKRDSGIAQKLSPFLADTSAMPDEQKTRQQEAQKQHEAMLRQIEADAASDMPLEMMAVHSEPDTPDKKAVRRDQIDIEEKLKVIVGGTYSEEEKRGILQGLKFLSADEIEILMHSKQLFDLSPNATKEELREWKDNVKEVVVDIRQARRRSETTQLLEKTKKELHAKALIAEMEKQQEETKKAIEAETLKRKEDLRKAIEEAQAGKASTARDTSTEQTSAVPTPTTSAPRTTIKAVRPPISIRAGRVRKTVVKHIKVDSEIIGAKVREIVRNHPETAAAVATGVAVGLANSAVGGPGGFIGGAVAGGMGHTLVSRLLGRPRPEVSVPPPSNVTPSTPAEPTRLSPENIQRTNRGAGRGGGGSNNGGGGGLGFGSFFSRHWIIILFFILGAIIFFFIINQNASYLNPFENLTNKEGTNGNSSLKIVKSGPYEVPNGAPIPYSITVTNTSSAPVKAVLTDKIPTGTIYQSSEPQAKIDNNTAKWEIDLGPNASKTISLTVMTVNKDFWAMNQATGSSTGSGPIVGGSCPSDEAIKANRSSRETCVPLNPAIPLFDTPISEEQIQKYIELNVGRHPAGKADMEQKTRYIVAKAKQAGFNPVIFLGLWITESGTGTNMGCDPFGGHFPGFEAQVDCATGLVPGGSIAISCAKTRDANSEACKLASGIINSAKNADVYHGVYKPEIPITTFDDFNKLYGPLSPGLKNHEHVDNNNCINTYNTLIEVAKSIGGCVSSASQVVPGSQEIASCKFYRNDQSGANCPPPDQGFRCQQALEFKSPVLLGHIKAASQKTGVPQEVLAAFVRVESTVPIQYSATKKSYSISDYSDADIAQMKNPITAFDDIDKTIGGSNKAMCPRSTTGALGIMQIQPPQQVHDAVIASIEKNNKSQNRNYTVPSPNQPSESMPRGLAQGAQAIGKTIATLTVDDFCDPQKNMIMASYVFFDKMGMSKWSPPSDPAKYEEFITKLAANYYGNDAQTGSYGNSVWRSVSQCKGAN